MSYSIVQGALLEFVFYMFLLILSAVLVLPTYVYDGLTLSILSNLEVF